MPTTINVDIRALANLLDSYADVVTSRGDNPDSHEAYRLLNRQVKQHRDSYMTDPTAPLVVVDQWQGSVQRRGVAKVETVKLIRAATGSTVRWAYDEACALETVGRRLPRETREAIEAIGVTFTLVGDDIS